jgi:type I restriction enzyme R subunit
MNSNFTFLPLAFKDLAEASRKAEDQIMGDPRAACFHARFALEVAVRWLYRYDTSLRMAARSEARQGIRSDWNAE